MLKYVYVALVTIACATAVFIYAYKTSPVAGANATFGDASLRVEFATTTAARQLGLSGRPSVPDNYGLLFAFKYPDLYGIWMKGMQVPLDIFWLDDKGQVLWILQNVQPSSYPTVFYPPTPALYVLETKAGFAQAHGVATGTPLQLKNFPSVSE